MNARPASERRKNNPDHYRVPTSDQAATSEYTNEVADIASPLAPYMRRRLIEMMSLFSAPLYLDRWRIFLRLRLRRRMRFFLHCNPESKGEHAHEWRSFAHQSDHATILTFALMMYQQKGLLR